MKKELMVFSMLVFSLFAAQSQIVASEGKMDYKKRDKSAAIIEMPYSPEIVESAIKDYLSQRGDKQDKSKGFQVFRNAKISGYDEELNDLYFNVERKSRKEKDMSVVYLIVAKPGEDIALRSVDNRYKMDAGINFLNQMVASVESYNLNVEIANQEEIVAKAEKKLKNLEEDQRDMEKRVKNLQEKLEENRKSQQKQAEEIMKQKTDHEALKAKKRG